MEITTILISYIAYLHVTRAAAFSSIRCPPNCAIPFPLIVFIFRPCLLGSGYTELETTNSRGRVELAQWNAADFHGT